MRVWWLFLVLIACGAATQISCGSKCRITADCETGEHCDFTTGDCIQGCEREEDCPGPGTCNLESGRCELIDTPRRDSGIPTTTTSTNPDASIRD